MRFMLLQNYAGGAGCTVPMSEWAPEDVQAHIDYQRALNRELTERGELVDAQALTVPSLAKFVISNGIGAPAVTDGPFPETKELLAGYRLVDVESPERAVAIAALVSSAPALGGVPIQQPIEVREVMADPGAGG
ncbi:MAG TPA: YciI family protein [Solirubrobacteraceae bacterium]|nr:YciI family protein [Solirubrobacteraceae bacterium]